LSEERNVRGKLEVLPSHEALLEAAAERVMAAAAAAIPVGGAGGVRGVGGAAGLGSFRIALSGGSTPKGLYERLAQPRYAARVDWACVHVFWGDERCVPASDPASNQRMARETWLDHVPLPAVNLHAIRGEGDPVTAADAYERDLRDAFATPSGPPRTAPGARFDLVLLGLGVDGHTASLFPGSPALRETQRWVCAQRVEELAAWRISLTPLVINAAAEVIFLVSGAEKAAILRRALAGPREPERLPAQAVFPHTGELRWLADAAAAAELARRERR
jgi:6-phosphogluconolactonase